MIECDDNKQVSRSSWPRGVGMIYLGMSPWHGMWKSRHQLMTRFSREMPVLYVEPAVTLQAVRTGRVGLTRVFWDALGPRSSKVSPDVSIMQSSAWYPLSGSRKLSSLTQSRWLSAVRRAARDAGISCPVLWVSRPEMRFAVGRLGECMSIYHIVDEYTGYTGLGAEGARRLRKEEAALLDSVNLSVAASPEIIEAKKAPGRSFVLLENGVSFRAYSVARRHVQQPDDIASIPHPIIGYSGLIGKRLNLELIAGLATARPDWSIVMVGRIDDRECKSQLEGLSGLPNVYLLGEKPPAETPHYVCAFDVGLLPYTINLETQHISPIKMYEYWAAGIPAIGTDIPSVRRNSDAVLIGKSTDDFLALIESVLGRFSEKERQGLLERAEKNSWARRVDVIGREIAARLGRSDGRAAEAPTPRVAAPSCKGH